MDSSTRPFHLRGIAAAPGRAAGEAHIWSKVQVRIPEYPIQDPQAEIARLRTARVQAGQEIESLQKKVEREVGPQEAAVFEAHAMFLDDPTLIDAAEDSIRNGLNSEAAWMRAVTAVADELAQIPDPTLSERAADVRDVGRRVLAHLLGGEIDSVPQLAHPVIIIAQDLEPSETAALEKRFILGFCLAGGGPTSHTAILAKAMGIPAVVGLGEAILNLPDQAPLLLDGTAGVVTAFPSPSDFAEFEKLRKAAEQISLQELSHAQEPAVTRDGRRVEVVANIGSLSDAHQALQMGAEGVGLLRTEFLYLDRAHAPSEDEQAQVYKSILDVFGARPVVVRTLDVGGDKQLAYLDLGQEANPFLGWRAIRMCLDNPDFFKVQLRALLRSAPGHDLRIMLPMIATLDEVRQANRLIGEARQELVARGMAPTTSIQVGIMVEVPSTAVMADRFAAEVDFFSVGTNDLTQYTFAAERTNQRVAHLGDAIHPAILRQIGMVIEAAHAAGIWVGVCGELAGDPQAIPILLGLGLDEFSMAPASIPHAKAVIRQCTLIEAQKLAQASLNFDSAAEVRQFIKEHPSHHISGSF